MIRRTLACTLVVTILWTSTWAAAPVFGQETSQNDIRYEEAVAHLDRIEQFLANLRSHIDRTQFDLEDLVVSLDLDEERIVRFVKGEIYFEQYPGLLRGALGTLLSRAGNALDQAILAATLLKDAGLEAVIVSGTLSSEDANSLVLQMTRPRPVAPDPFDAMGVKKTLLEAGAASGLSAEALRELEQTDLLPDPSRWAGVPEEISQGAAVIQKAMASLGYSTGAADPEKTLEQLVTEAQQYFWVRYRLGPSSAWNDTHVAFAEGAPEEAVQPDRVFASEIPAALQHRLRVELELTQRVGDSEITRPLMDPWERPVANLVGLPISISLMPLGLTNLKMTDDPRARLESSSFFVPLLGDALPPGGVAFDLNGRTVSPDVLQLGATGYFQELGNKVEGAASALSGMGAKKTESGESRDLMHLAQVTLRLHFATPGEEVLTVERDLLGAPSRRAGEDSADSEELALKWQISKNHTLMLAPGRYPTGYIEDQAISVLSRLTPAVRSAVEIVNRGVLPEDPPPEFRELQPRRISHLSVFRAFDGGVIHREGLTSYRHGPGAVVLTSPLLPREGDLDITDVISNPKRMFEAREGKLRSSFEEQVLAGVWETAVEGLGAQPVSPEITPTAALQRASRSGREPLAITPAQVGRLESLELGQETARHIRKDLEAGFVVLVPAGEDATSGDATAWWRVDPDSGQTLGMMYGRGTSLTEFAVMLLPSLIGALVGIFTVVGCMESIRRGTGEVSGAAAIGCTICALFAAAGAWLGGMVAIEAAPGMAAADISAVVTEFGSVLKWVLATLVGACAAGVALVVSDANVTPAGHACEIHPALRAPRDERTLAGG